MTAEQYRLEEDRYQRAHWRQWGPYLSDRQWGTVREDYSPGGGAWEYFPHQHARSRAYRWGEDGLLGISDNHQRLCFALALWNGNDPFLKERLFGLTGNEGNHGEDVKEYYHYLDNTPTHSYMKALYKYPQAAFPYQRLLEENRCRGRQAPEFELIDTGIFDENRYFDVVIEYAKETPSDLVIRIGIFNRGPEPAAIHVLPTLWYRNTWVWNHLESRPLLSLESMEKGPAIIRGDHPTLGTMFLAAEVEAPALFTDNESNVARVFDGYSPAAYFKDGINDFIVQGNKNAVNPLQRGTKSCICYQRILPPGESWFIRLRLSKERPSPDLPGTSWDRIIDNRAGEADDFYRSIAPSGLDDDSRNIQRQAFAGLLWTKQYYHYVVQDWLDGDPGQPPPPPGHRMSRNREWGHLHSDDVLSMPDKWEYPWFAAWDLAFHCIPLAIIDPEFAKRQLILLTREWYMHPNGQLPAYEWAFGDVNPPVHAWAALRVYKIEEKFHGRADRHFLERVFQKLLLNFTWWVNRKDAEGNNIFQGGFLGLDNIGVFDRSRPLPSGRLEQSDGTSWMAMYCLNLLTIAIELAKENPSYEDIASKFFEHFLRIANAMSGGQSGVSLWDEEDGFFYDRLHLKDGQGFLLKIRSMVGLIPMFAVETLENETLFGLSGFSRRFNWFMEHRPDLAGNVHCQGNDGVCERRILAILSPEKLRRILARLLSEDEFLSPYGIRGLSKVHRDNPFILQIDGVTHQVDYEPAESHSGLFGGNSNWRGPVWFPVNYLIIESLQKFHYYMGDEFQVECPTGSGCWMTLWEVAAELSRRLIRIFQRDPAGRRPVAGGIEKFYQDPHWKDLLLFYEYFHGDNGAGIGASHQTGWTGLVAKLIQQRGEYGN
jgi:hypothetical protein